MNNNQFSTTQIKEIWTQSCSDLQTQLTPAVYTTWIATNPLTQLELLDANRAIGTITCPTAFHATNLKKNLYTQIKATLEKSTNLSIDLQFVVGTVNTAQEQPKSNNKYPNKKQLKISQSPTSPSVNIESDTSSQPMIPHRQINTKPTMQPIGQSSINQSVGRITTPEKPTNKYNNQNKFQPQLKPQPQSQFQQQHQAQPGNQPQPQQQTNLGSPTVEELFSAHSIQASIKDRYLSSARRIGLRTDYNFETFAVSTSNEMAHAAASAVSANPGTAYNPLFLHGGVGVGKTHLMQAIGQNILKKNPETKMIYCTGEEFTNEIISAIQKKKAYDFKKKYRNVQVLLIDDIQFIAGKNAVQEEFFHTFNSLTKHNSQIILTSDRPPHEINLLEDRLRSRFEAGLMIDIQQPSFELRTAILLIKANAINMSIPMDIAQMISSKVDSARKIEGIINQIRSEVELKNRVIDVNLIEDILRSENTLKVERTITVSPQDVIKTVSNHFRVKQSAVKGKRRTKDLVRARHIAMYLLRTELKLSLEEIGKWFSGRDHTSVLHATQKIEKNLSNDNSLKQDISALKMSLTSISSR